VRPRPPWQQRRWRIPAQNADCARQRAPRPAQPPACSRRPIPTADDIIQRNQVALVARSREMVANNDHARAFIRMCRQNIVGPGVMLQAQAKKSGGKLDADANAAIESSWGTWGHRKTCTVTGKKSWRAVQLGAVRDAAKDGEFFVRKIYGTDAGPWGFALQTIDPQRCPVTLDVQRLNGGSNFIRAGIEFNRYGRPVAYYFTTTDESEQAFVYSGRKHVRISADEIIHGFVEDIEGQKRGLPWMATGLLRLRNLQGYEEAAVIGQRISASKMCWIAFDKDVDEAPEYDEDSPPEMDADPGTFGILPRGARIETFAPAAASGEFLPFTKHTLRGIAAGWGVPYNELAADLEGVNFSSIRQGTLDSREHWKELQEWLIESLVQPVFEAWLEYSLLKGRIVIKGKPLQASKIDQYSAVAWQARRWTWIDPNADVKAAVESKNNFLKSPGEIIREQGNDPQTVWIETARDMRAQVDALVAEGFERTEAMDLVKMSFGIQPKPPAPAAKPQPKATE
jgi:lambda family phage portal protein